MEGTNAIIEDYRSNESMKTFMLLLVVGITIANCEDESGAIYFNGGRPTQIAFPIEYQNVKWMANRFTIHTSLIINNRSGKVVRLDIINNGISYSSESPNLEKIMPRWKIVFASLIFEATKKWEFSKRTRLDKEPLDEIGFPLDFMFSKNRQGLAKVQIFEGVNLLADDSPNVLP